MYGYGEFFGVGKYGYEGFQKVVFVYVDVLVDFLRVYVIDFYDGNIRFIVVYELFDVMYFNILFCGK